VNCCNAIDSHFEDNHAERDLSRYQKNGPDPTTQRLIRAVREARLHRARLLDIGAGIGVLQHELLDGTVESVEHVDASTSYLRTAREECTRRGNGDKVTFISGDFTEIHEQVSEVDIVLMDRVLCCYPVYFELVRLSTDRCKSLYAISYPKNTLFTRVVFYLDNVKRRLQGHSFRSYLHPVVHVESQIVDAGFSVVSVEQTLLWRIAVFKRVQ
jgi:2-polyprenyl-3-methyl-5-hydroxy-6-metoxy-1,4-benzoquinol methylase